MPAETLTPKAIQRVFLCADSPGAVLELVRAYSGDFVSGPGMRGWSDPYRSPDWRLFVRAIQSLARRHDGNPFATHEQVTRERFDEYLVNLVEPPVAADETEEDETQRSRIRHAFLLLSEAGLIGCDGQTVWRMLEEAKESDRRAPLLRPGPGGAVRFVDETQLAPAEVRPLERTRRRSLAAALYAIQQPTPEFYMELADGLASWAEGAKKDGPLAERVCVLPPAEAGPILERIVSTARNASVVESVLYERSRTRVDRHEPPRYAFDCAPPVHTALFALLGRAEAQGPTFDSRYWLTKIARRGEPHMRGRALAAMASIDSKDTLRLIDEIGEGALDGLEPESLAALVATDNADLRLRAIVASKRVAHPETAGHAPQKPAAQRVG